MKYDDQRRARRTDASTGEDDDPLRLFDEVDSVVDCVVLGQFFPHL